MIIFFWDYWIDLKNEERVRDTILLKLGHVTFVVNLGILGC